MRKKTVLQLGIMAATTICQVHAEEPSRYMGADVMLLGSDGMWHVPIGNGSGVPEL